MDRNERQESIYAVEILDTGIDENCVEEQCCTDTSTAYRTEEPQPE